MKYERVEISIGDMDKLVEQCCKILTVWQHNTPEKVVMLTRNDAGETEYKVFDVPDGPLVLDE